MRAWREGTAARIGFDCHFPIWGSGTTDIIDELVGAGFKATVCSANSNFLDESFVGCRLDHDFVKRLPDGVDPCGERGEFHSFVWDGPIFDKPISFSIGHKEFRPIKPGGECSVSAPRSAPSLARTEGTWYVDLLTAKPHLTNHRSKLSSAKKIVSLVGRTAWNFPPSELLKQTEDVIPPRNGIATCKVAIPIFSQPDHLDHLFIAPTDDERYDEVACGQWECFFTS